MAGPITVSVTTRNRPAALERCLRSLSCISDLVDRVIVVDDASEPPVDAGALVRAASIGRLTVDFVRLGTHSGTAAGKNLIARRATSPYLLSLDDDAFLVSDRAVRDALCVLQQDASVAAVAFAQCDEHGRRRPAAQQPASAMSPCFVPAFIGFGCLIARDRLLETGGYRETFVIHGEEREVCLRWLDRGLHVVYLPDALVAHVADAGNRDARSYVRQVMRNDCLAAIYNDPLPRALCVVPYKVWSYTRMRAAIPGGDSGGLIWILRELAHHAPRAFKERQPVSWRTLREWNRLRTATPPYRKSSAAA